MSVLSVPIFRQTSGLRKASLANDAACYQLLASATHLEKGRKHERRSSRQDQNILVALDTLTFSVHGP
jgi:hypothetical protein